MPLYIIFSLSEYDITFNIDVIQPIEKEMLPQQYSQQMDGNLSRTMSSESFISVFVQRLY